MCRMKYDRCGQITFNKRQKGVIQKHELLSKKQKRTD